MFKTLLRLFAFDPDDPVNHEELELKEEKAPSGLILPSISRRNFLFGAAATAVTASTGGKVFSFARALLTPRSGFIDPVRFDALNLRTWGRVPWTTGEVLALQLESVHKHLPLLIENDPRLAKLIGDGKAHRISGNHARSMQWLRARHAGIVRSFELDIEEANRLYPQATILEKGGTDTWLEQPESQAEQSPGWALP